MSEPRPAYRTEYKGYPIEKLPELGERWATMKELHGCKCDPVGSGMEFCSGHCYLNERIRTLETRQSSALTTLRDLARTYREQGDAATAAVDEHAAVIVEGGEK